MNKARKDDKSSRSLLCKPYQSTYNELETSMRTHVFHQQLSVLEDEMVLFITLNKEELDFYYGHTTLIHLILDFLHFLLGHFLIRLPSPS